MERGTKGRTIPLFTGLEFTVAWLEAASSLLSSTVPDRHHIGMIIIKLHKNIFFFHVNW
jgi:hypothetical protein